MLSQEAIDDIHEFARKLIEEQEKDSIHSSLDNKEEMILSQEITDDLEEFAEKLVTAQEEKSVKNLLVPA